MIRGLDRLYLCLYENWYDNRPNVDNMVRYNLRFYEDPVIFHKDDLAAVMWGDAVVYYLCPLFFASRELGLVILCFEKPDTFDHIFRNWLKSIANGLELLRMKNDIRYLAACQNLSEQHDNLTSMLNENGLRRAFESANRESLYMVALQIGLFDADLSAVQTSEKVYAMLDAAEAVRQFCGQNGIPARTHRNTFLCLIKSTQTGDFLTSLLMAILCRHTACMSKYGMDSFVCIAEVCDTLSFDELNARCEASIQAATAVIADRRRKKQYAEMLAFRNLIYRDPDATFDTDKLRADFSGSAGHLRNLYKECFGVSFHQDCIAARIAKAKYLLAVTDCNVQEAAYQCGYSDNKYFMRQFLQETGMTAKDFRLALSES